MNPLVYVLDDDPVGVALCAGILRGLGCTVRVPKNADSLLEAMAKQAPDIVFLDLMMPGVDGLTLCRRIRENPAFQTVKVVIMSAKKFAADKASAARVGADAYLEKPYGAPQVQDLLDQLIVGRLEVRFWGVRGSIAAPSPANQRYGGNTSCVATKLKPNEYIVFDAGTGIRELGNYLANLGQPLRLNLFISHPHWDHIQGLPFFRPGYDPQNEITIYGADQPDTPLEEVISHQMHSTYFPVPLEAMGAQLRFESLQEGHYEMRGMDKKESTTLANERRRTPRQFAEGYDVETLYLKHPGTTLGFRLRLRGKSLVYLCDNEITDDDPHFRTRLVTFLRDSDLLIADAQYTPADFPEKRGWGHSLYTDVVSMALEANIQRLILTHHDPDRHDDDIDRILENARRTISERGSEMECKAGAEGMAVYL